MPIKDEALELPIEISLTPGLDYYRTYAPNNSHRPERRIQIIPNQPKTRPTPVPLIVGQRRKGKPMPKPPFPPLSMPLPPPSPPAPLSQRRPNLSDIQFTGATNFLQFCKDPTIKAMKIT